MDIPPELQDAESFLEEFRACNFRTVLLHWNYHKNRDFIERSGITKEEVYDILLVQLNSSHFKKGPEEEKDSTYPNGIIYTFRFPWREYKIYIKLKIMTEGTKRMTLCMSFHD